jgi:protein SCO1/2
MHLSKRALGRLILLGAAGIVLAAVTLIATFNPIGLSQTIQIAAAIGGPFRLTTQNGSILDSRDLAGRPFALFFGFTHCPDVCPTTLTQISQVLRQLGPEGADLRVFFVTVDPERDTPEVLRDYLSNFDRRIVGLWGTPDQIAAVAREYKAYYERVPTSDGGYTMDHTAVVYLMNRRGRYNAPIGYAEDQASYLAKFRALLEAP